MWPRRRRPRYEARIRAAAGLGSAPDARDAERYDKRYAHCDVLVVGGGPADWRPPTRRRDRRARDPGGRAARAGRQPAVLPGRDRRRAGIALGRAHRGGLRQRDVRILTRSTAFGYQDHNLVTVAQRLTDHLPVRMRAGSRELLEDPGRPGDPGDRRARASAGVRQQRPAGRDAGLGRVGLYPSLWRAAGAMRCCSPTMTAPIRRPSIWPIAAPGSSWWMPAPGRRHPAGRRPAPGRDRDGRRRRDGRARQAAGRVRRRARICQGPVRRARRDLPCDLLAMSGGSPVLHLHAQSGGKPQWLERKACFVPGKSVQAEASVGAAAGEFDLCLALAQATRAGAEAASAAGSPSRRRCPFPGGVHRRGRADAAVAGGRSTRRARPQAVRRFPE